MSAKASSPKIPQKSDTYAIVETSGSQFWLEPNRYLDLNRIDADIDQIITLEKVLLINDGKDIKLGKPYIKDARVELKIMAHRRGPKILVYKMRPKKKTRRKNGHRQELTRVMVKSISIGSKAKSEKASAKTKTTSIKSSKTSSKKNTPSKDNEEVK
tara:strand:- start:5166 stop:5636 length:471 start_codon:yes stop_codon:yes gene_type:complete